MNFLHTMMTRRSFLRRSAGGWLAIATLPLLSRCGGSGDTKTISQDSDATGENHKITINCADIDSPPSGGVTVTSTTSGGHTHNVTLSETNLAQIAAGEAVQVTSSAASGHTHTFSITSC